MTLLFGCTWAILSATMPASLAGQQAGTLNAGDVLARFVQALGGEPRLKAKGTRKLRATLADRGGERTQELVVWQSTPNLWAFEMALPDQRSVNLRFDGTAAWGRRPRDSDFQPVPASGITGPRRLWDPGRSLALLNEAGRFRLLGRQRVDDKDAWVLEGNPGDCRKETLYFDAATGFLFRTDLDLGPADQPRIEKHYFDDYREIAGLWIAHSIRTTVTTTDRGVFESRITIQEVDPNAKPDPSVFARP